MNLCKILIFWMILILSLSGCGSDSGYVSAIGEASVKIISPGDDESYSAGSSVSYHIETIDFHLAPPFNKRSLTKNHPDDISDETTEMHHKETPTEDHHDPAEETAPHDHGSSETNPNAVEGHYHVYLDAASGSDPHLTAWTETGEFQLPEDLHHGTHSLRFELRDNNHILIGTPGSEAVVFFTVG